MPGFAVSAESGLIKVVEYKSENLIVPLVISIINTDLSGSSCILTNTNDEAVQVAGLLNEKGIAAKLIQANDGFNLASLCELRYFSGLLGQHDSPLISEEEWTGATKLLSSQFSKSNKFEIALNIITQFSLINSIRKYKSDWFMFLNESKIEDFINIDNEIILVSTIHKAKGKEFNNVFLLLKDFDPKTDEKKRQLYVGITRAKSNLYIHYNDNFLADISDPGLSYTHDAGLYNPPEQIAVHLTHRDVQLGYFEFVQNRMAGLQSGDNLTLLTDGLGNSKKELVIKYSAAFKEALEIKIKQGFLPSGAAVNFQLYWKDEKKAAEVKILLPKLILKKRAVTSTVP